MQNDNSKKENKKNQYGDALRKIVDWKIKNKFLQEQIAILEKTQNFPIFAISCFLLKTQLIEFELKQLITGLDLHLYFSNTSTVLKMVTRTPKDLGKKMLTLGRLRDEINEYEGSFLKDIKFNLSKLITLRNQFVHEVFNPGSIKELIMQAEEGLKTANIVLNNIKDVNSFLEVNDPIKMRGKVDL